MCLIHIARCYTGGCGSADNHPAESPRTPCQRLSAVDTSRTLKQLWLPVMPQVIKNQHARTLKLNWMRVTGERGVRFKMEGPGVVTI